MHLQYNIIIQESQGSVSSFPYNSLCIMFCVRSWKLWIGGPRFFSLEAL